MDEFMDRNMSRLGLAVSPILTNLHNMGIARAVARNWYDVALFRAGLKSRFTLVLRSGKRVPMRNMGDHAAFWTSAEPNIERLRVSGYKVSLLPNRVVALSGRGLRLRFFSSSKGQLSSTVFLLCEQFADRVYGWLDVKGRQVVDIGANIGDTAIYFAVNGARHVYAYEPFPHSFDTAKRNVQSNGLSGRITLLNEALGLHEEKVLVGKRFRSDASSTMKQFKRGREVAVTTLHDIVKKNRIGNGAVLKIDCEGGEYGTILNAPDSTLRKFSQMMIEYHYGYANLERKLRSAGFAVRHTLPKRTFNASAKDHNMFIVLIYARLRR